MILLERVIKYMIMESAKPDSTFMIAFYPTDETIANIIKYRNQIKRIHDLSSMQEIHPENLHATIRIWETEQGNFHKIIADLNNFNFDDLVNAKVIDVDVLGNSLSIMLNSTKMHKTFEKIDNLVQGHGGPPSDYPNYNPHVALFYGDWDKVIVDQVAEVPDFSLSFNRIMMKDNLDNIYFNKVFM
jgi:2'-5' RNA ligase